MTDVTICASRRDRETLSRLYNMHWQELMRSIKQKETIGEMTKCQERFTAYLCTQHVLTHGSGMRSYF